MSRRAERTYIRADYMADYLDEHDGEIPCADDFKEPEALRYGGADIEDIDKLINKIYGNL